MKRLRKKGLWFSLGLEILGGLLCFVCGIAYIVGYFVEVFATLLIISIITGIFAAGETFQSRPCSYVEGERQARPT